MASLLLAQNCQKSLNDRKNWSCVAGLKEEEEEEEAAVSAGNSRENKWETPMRCLPSVGEMYAYVKTTQANKHTYTLYTKAVPGHADFEKLQK